LQLADGRLKQSGVGDLKIRETAVAIGAPGFALAWTAKDGRLNMS